MSTDDSAAANLANNVRIRRQVKLILKNPTSDGKSPEQRIRSEFSGAELQTALSILKKRTTNIPDVHQPSFKPVVNPKLAAELASEQRVTPDLGSHYHVDETGPLGVGGKGTVWKAENRRLKRDVAVKFIVRTGNREQLEAEAQRLATVDHQNVVRVYGFGYAQKPTQAAYLEMALVHDALSITKFCNLKRFSVRRRLELFIGVCNGVFAAHEKRILHLDLKPDNILVSQTAPDSIAQVIDFGLAKLTTDKNDARQADSSARPAGTDHYLAPEQIEGEVGFRTDVYVLGLILFELLTGRVHHSILLEGETSLQEQYKKIRSVEPTIPSEWLQRAAGDASIAENRSTTLPALARELSGDLDWIVRLALDNNPDKRYASAEALAADIQRHLDDEIVLAHPQTRTYSWPKIYRKHRLLTWSTLLVFLSMTIGLTFSTIGYVVARKARAEAENSEDQTLEVLRQGTDDAILYLIGSKSAVGPREEQYLLESLDRWKSIAGRNGDDSRTKAIRGEGHFRVGSVNMRLGRIGDAKDAYTEAVRIFDDLLQRFPENPAHKQNLASALFHLSTAMSEKGNDVTALLHGKRSYEYRTELQKQFPNNTQLQAELAQSCNLLGILRSASGDKSGLDLFNQGEELLNSLILNSPSNLDYLRSQGNLFNSSGIAHLGLGNANLAVTKYRSASDVFKNLTGERITAPQDVELYAVVQGNLANALIEVGDFEGADAAHQKAMQLRRDQALEFPSIPEFRRLLGASYANYARFLECIGENEEAARQHGSAINVLQGLYDEYPSVSAYQFGLAFSREGLGCLLAKSGKADAALTELAASETVIVALMADSPDVTEYSLVLARILGHRGNLNLARNQLDAADIDFAAAVTILQPLCGNSSAPEFSVSLANVHGSWGIAFAKRNKHAKAIGHFEEAMSRYVKLSDLSPNNPSFKAGVATNTGNCALSLRAIGKTEDSEKKFQLEQRLLFDLVKQFPEATDFRISLGGVYGNQGHGHNAAKRFLESLPVFNNGIETLSTGFSEEFSDTQRDRFLRSNYAGRAESYLHLSRFADAAADFKRVVELSPPSERPTFLLSRVEALLRARIVPEAAAELDELYNTPTWTIDQIFLLAKLHAMATEMAGGMHPDYGDRAMQLITAIVESEHFTPALEHQLRIDQEFNCLRERADFKSLMSSLPEPQSASQDANP